MSIHPPGCRWVSSWGLNTFTLKISSCNCSKLKSFIIMCIVFCEYIPVIGTFFYERRQYLDFKVPSFDEDNAVYDISLSSNRPIISSSTETNLCFYSILKRHSNNCSHEVQFTCHVANVACENSCIMLSEALEQLRQQGNLIMGFNV